MGDITNCYFHGENLISKINFLSSSRKQKYAVTNSVFKIEEN